MIPTELFVSYSSLDHEFATRLVATLRHHGVPVWFAPSNILGAQQWHDELGAALRRCDWFLIVLSPNAVDSMWVRRELAYALRQRRLSNRIVPVVWQPCELEDLSFVLPGLQLVDFQHDFTTGCRDLLRIWGIGYQAVDPSP
jgi:hypothetical protein